MLDVIFIGVVIAFFSLSLAYLAACNALRKGAEKQ